MGTVEDIERLVGGSDQFLKRGIWSLNRRLRIEKSSLILTILAAAALKAYKEWDNRANSIFPFCPPSVLWEGVHLIDQNRISNTLRQVLVGTK